MNYKSCVTADHSYLGRFFLSPLVTHDVVTLFLLTVQDSDKKILTDNR